MKIFTITKDLTSYNNKKQLVKVENKIKISPAYRDRYGIDLTDQEINFYRTNIDIWSTFLKESNEEYCMIIEKGIKLSKPIETIEKELESLPLHWEVFFPFDKLNKRENNIELALSKFGFYWGAYIYCINRRTVANLLKKFEKQVLGPLDEVLLEEGISKRIKLLYAATDWFHFDQKKSTSLIARKESIVNFIRNYNIWKPKEIKQARDILQYVSNIAQSNKLKIFLHAGTLLGYIRHGKIMDWDDDIDLMMEREEALMLIDKIRRESQYQVTEWTWKKTGNTYYKIWKRGGFKVEGYEYTFPFVDVWILDSDKETDKGDTNDGYCFSYDTYYPLRKIEFEDCAFYRPNNSVRILDTMYNGWREKIHIFSWSHKHKKHSIKQIIIPIKSNKAGRFLNYK